jgi:hypothetical protein
MDNQEKININVQERLRRMEASNGIISAFLFAVGETHQDKEALRKQFLLRSEILISKSLSSGIQEDYIDSSIAYRDALLHALDQTKK